MSEKYTHNHDIHHDSEHEIHHNVYVEGNEGEEGKDSGITAGAFLRKDSHHLIDIFGAILKTYVNRFLPFLLFTFKRGTLDNFGLKKWSAFGCGRRKGGASGPFLLVRLTVFDWFGVLVEHLE